MRHPSPSDFGRYDDVRRGGAPRLFSNENWFDCSTHAGDKERGGQTGATTKKNKCLSCLSVSIGYHTREGNKE